MTDVTAKAMTKEGDIMDLITAIHEAGHAVAHRQLFGDRDFSWGMALVPDEEEEAQGRMEYARPLG